MRPIDADALVLELCQRNNKPYPSSFNHDFIVMGVLRDFLVCIAEAPTLDYAPVRHGEWIMKSYDNFGVCSCCNRSDYIDSLATHCRYCGAKMDGGKNE